MATRGRLHLYDDDRRRTHVTAGGASGAERAPLVGLRLPPRPPRPGCRYTARMEMTLLLAMDEAGLIGANGQLPWRLPNDLKRFRRQTMGRTVVMGRSTFESIGRPLDGRENWVLTRDATFSAEGVRVFHDLDSVLAAAPDTGLAVIGGATLYEQFMPWATHIELTRVHARLPGDTWFSDPALKAWKVDAMEVAQPDARHAYAYSFLSLTPR